MPRKPRPAQGITTARERPSGASWRFSPPRLHMLAIPGSSTTPQRPLKTISQVPPKPLKEKTPFPSVPQSNTNIALHPRATAMRSSIFILSQKPSPQRPCPKRRRFQVAMPFLAPFRGKTERPWLKSTRRFRAIARVRCPCGILLEQLVLPKYLIFLTGANRSRSTAPLGLTRRRTGTTTWG